MYLHDSLEATFAHRVILLFPSRGQPSREWRTGLPTCVWCDRGDVGRVALRWKSISGRTSLADVTLIQLFLSQPHLES